jgi:hypothetical protein
MSEIYLLGLDIIFGHVYERKPIKYQELSPELITYITGFRPRLPVGEFPEDYPDEDGYTGDYFTLYRGLCFEKEEQYRSFLNSISDGYIDLAEASSWSINSHIAEKFSKGANYKDIVGFYKGIVMKIPRVEVDGIFFSVLEAHGEMEYSLPERFVDKDNRSQFSWHEEEFVLMPGRFKVEMVNDIDLD